MQNQDNLTILKITNLNFSYEKSEVLKNINFSIKNGKSVAILGKSGVGKSTLFDIIAGFKKPKSGEILIQNPFNHLLKIGYMQQKTLLLEHKNVFDNIALPLLLNKISKDIIYQKTIEILKEFEILEYKNFYPNALSGGLKSRVCFARAMVLKAAIYLLDEPFSSLDLANKNLMHKYFLKTIKKQNLTTLLITHDIDEAIKLAQEIYVLEKNELNQGIIVNKFENILSDELDENESEKKKLLEEKIKKHFQ